ncbi:MAG: trypsin-like peptidase domain-containing protein [Lachnospiraceae bacterium]|nr:trypsin-like peptidase domain-containing protein [Lachnospiraceae bacterium]
MNNEMNSFNETQMNEHLVNHTNQSYQFNDMGQQMPKQEPTDKKAKKKAGVLRYLVIALLCGALAGGAFEGSQYAVNKLTAQKQTTAEQTSTDEVRVATNTSTSTISSGVAEVASNVMPSIVAVNVTSTQTINYWGQNYSQEQSGSGSGIIIGENNKELFIVTNNHVIEGDDVKVSLTFNDETTADAEIKGADSSSDLAVLSVQKSDLSSSTKSSIKIASIGDSDNVKVGDMAIAIGNALGYGQSVTVGYISAKDREVTFEDGSMKLLQTDAAINPGNSGGALLNSSGEVIGINSSKYSDESVEGMGFAIPISKAVPIINELMNREQLDVSEQGYLGIKGQDITESVSEAYNMPQGIYVGEVSKGSPAEKAGIVAGNIITEINGRSVTTLEALQEVLTYTKAGTKVTLTVKELSEGNYEDKTIEVTLGSKSEAGTTTTTEDEQQQQQRQQQQFPMN